MRCEGLKQSQDSGVTFAIARFSYDLLNKTGVSNIQTRGLFLIIFFFLLLMSVFFYRLVSFFLPKRPEWAAERPCSRRDLHQQGHHYYARI